jgi:hypothetical protein
MIDNRQWHRDEASNSAYKAMEDALQPLLGKVMPSHLLTHFGINRDFNTDEVIIKLHLRPLGQAKVIKDHQAIMCNTTPLLKTREVA